jgi:Uma2 family endonuclease
VVFTFLSNPLSPVSRLFVRHDPGDLYRRVTGLYRFEIVLLFYIMATILHISLHEYLETDYRPDREFVDGEIRERNVGKWEHARLQLVLGAWFFMHEKEWGITCSTEQRIRVAENRVRVPDLVVLTAGPQPEVLTDPPLLVIEILSPGDSYTDTEERTQDYCSMGVETVWIVDPKTRTGRMCSVSEWVASSRLEVKGTPIYVELPAIFSQVAYA